MEIVKRTAKETDRSRAILEILGGLICRILRRKLNDSRRGRRNFRYHCVFLPERCEIGIARRVELLRTIDWLATVKLNGNFDRSSLEIDPSANAVLDNDFESFRAALVAFVDEAGIRPVRRRRLERNDK